MAVRGRLPSRGSVVTVALLSALVTATFMSAGFSFYLYRQQAAHASVATQSFARLRAETDRNSGLQKELLKLNASVADVMMGLDTVSSAVDKAKSRLQLAGPDRKNLEEALQTLRRENALLKERAADVASAQAAASAQQPAPAPVPVQPVSAQGAAPARWLTLGIPTVPRQHGERYLEQTVNAIIAQLPLRHDDPLFDRVVVVILNNQPGLHAIFDEIKAKVEAGPYARYFKFVEQAIAQSYESRNREGDPNVPVSKVRRQTRAAVAMLRASAGLASHFMFMEDDFILCPHVLYALQYIIGKAYAYKGIGFSGIR